MRDAYTRVTTKQGRPYEDPPTGPDPEIAANGGWDVGYVKTMRNIHRKEAEALSTVIEKIERRTLFSKYQWVVGTDAPALWITRSLLDVSQYELADLLGQGWSQGTISQLERGETALNDPGRMGPFKVRLENLLNEALPRINDRLHMERLQVVMGDIVLSHLRKVGENHVGDIEFTDNQIRSRFSFHGWHESGDAVLESVKYHAHDIGEEGVDEIRQRHLNAVPDLEPTP